MFVVLQEIVALTPEFHQDYEQLVTVMHDIQRVADHINEIKKRKDLVEQLIHQDCKSVCSTTWYLLQKTNIQCRL